MVSDQNPTPKPTRVEPPESRAIAAGDGGRRFIRTRRNWSQTFRRVSKGEDERRVPCGGAASLLRGPRSDLRVKVKSHRVRSLLITALKAAQWLSEGLGGCDSEFGTGEVTTSELSPS